MNVTLTLSLVYIGWRLCREDIQTRTVFLVDLVLYALVVLLFGTFSKATLFMGGFLLFSVKTANSLYKKQIMAEADQFLLFTLPFIVELDHLPYVLTLCGIFIFMMRLLLSCERTIPFSPPYFLSLMAFHLG